MHVDEDTLEDLGPEQRACIGKRRHDTELAATYEMHITMLSPYHAKLGRSLLHVYECPFCHGYHCGAVANQPWVRRTHRHREYRKADKPRKDDRVGYGTTGKNRTWRRRDKWS